MRYPLLEPLANFTTVRNIYFVINTANVVTQKGTNNCIIISMPNEYI